MKNPTRRPIFIISSSFFIKFVYTIVGTEGSGSHFNEALGILGCPALLHFSVFTELILHQVVFTLYTDGRERQWTKLQDSRTVTLR